MDGAHERLAPMPLSRYHDSIDNETHAGYSIRVPSTSLDALNLESIPLNDGTGDVWVSMNVYHHLHCLDSIRHQIAGVGCKDPQESVNQTEQYFPPHIDHCIETLRKRLICQPDLGVRAIAWNPDKPGVAFANNTVDSACVNWDAVQDWTRKHSFTEEEGLITRPDGETTSSIHLFFFSPLLTSRLKRRENVSRATHSTCPMRTINRMLIRVANCRNRVRVWVAPRRRTSLDALHRKATA